MYPKEDCRLRVGKETLDRSKLKSSLKPARSGVGPKPNDNMRSRMNANIRSIPWTCPPMFAMNCDWQVAAGEESDEVKSQNYREVRELEALYPRPSAIPPNPYVLKDAYDGHVEDTQVSEIPLKGIEEEEEEEETYMAAPSEASMQLQALDLPADFNPDITSVPVIDADVVAAASDVYNAIFKWNLINIVKNPGLIKMLVDHGLSGDNQKEPVAMVQEVIPQTPSVGPKKSCEASVASTSSGSLSVSTLTQVNSTVCVQNSNNMDGDDSKACEPSSSASTSTTGSLPVPTSSCVLPVATSTEMKVANGEPSNSGSESLSRQNTVKETDDASQQDCVGLAPFLWTPSAPFKMSESSETVIKNVMNNLSATCPSSLSSTQIPDSSLHVVPMAATDGTGLLPRHQLPNPSSHLGPSSLYSVPHNVPQPAPFVAITTPPTKDMGYFKGLVREHGNGLKTSKTSHVEVGQPHNHQQVPSTSIGQQSTSLKPRCTFFNTPGGCRNGDKCRFDHVAANLPNAGLLSQEGPESKKMKLT